MILSFKFSVYKVLIASKATESLGEFTLLCLRSIYDGMNISDMADVIQIKPEVIKKQLDFAKSRKYLTNDYTLTVSGKKIVSLFNFIQEFNQSAIKIALEHYIDDKNKKKIYLLSNKKLENEKQGYPVRENLYDYKVKKKFYEMLEIEVYRKKILCLGKFDDYKDLFRENIDDFEFQLIKTDTSKYYNVTLEENFVNFLKDERDGDGITINIPTLKISKEIDSKFLDKETITRIKREFETNYIDLISGETISLNSRMSENSQINVELNAILDAIDIARKPCKKNNVSDNELLFLDIKTNYKKTNNIKFMKVNNMMELLCGM